MKLDRGLYTDCTEQDQPPGTYRHAKNIIDAELLGVIENEDGFKEIGVLTPYTLIGVIPVRDSAVVFSTDNTSSEIGLVSKGGPGLVYSTIYNNPDLNFDTSAPIKGEYRKDITGGRIVAWIDDINSPRILNIDDVASIDDISDLDVFPDVDNPELITPVINDTGGALPTSAIIPMTQYQNVDGSTTNWFVHDFTFYINDDPKSGTFNANDGAAPGTTSNKSITFTLQGNDMDFSVINIGYLISIDNIVTAHKVAEVTNSASLTVTITGNETATDVTLDEVLISTANYTNAKAITQLAGRLYLGNLTATELPELQAAAMDIIIDYTLDLVNVTSNTDSHKDVLPPTFMPGEVYAFYLGVEFIKGGWGYYHIPGRLAVNTELDVVTEEGMTYTRFQVQNTSDDGSSYSNMGYWQNEGENYPDVPGFIGAVTGDQRNTPVRHHRFPLAGHLVDTYYSADSTVGITHLPTLGINVTGVNIPAEIQPLIKRWKIFFAKKEVNNSLVQGSDLLQFGAERNGLIVSTSGNWNSTDSDGSIFSDLNKNYLRGHSLDMYYANRSAAPTYFQTHYAMLRADLNDPYLGFRVSGGAGLSVAIGSPGGSCAAVLDYTVDTVRDTFRVYKKLSDFTYVPENSVEGTYSTVGGTGEFVANIDNAGSDFLLLVTINHMANLSVFAGGNQFYPVGGGPGDAVDTVGESTAYIQYFNLLTSVHNAFQGQDVVPTRGYGAPADTSLITEGGDSFLCYMSYLAASPRGSITTVRGVRMWKAYIGYSRYNFNYRYEEAGNIGNFYHGKTAVGTLFSPVVELGTLELNPTTLVLTNESQNIVSYTEDYNKMNIYSTGVIDHPSIINQTEFPNTVIYSPVQNDESLEFSWRTFRAGDRAVVGQNRGDIVNLQGFRNSILLIHTEDSLYRTRTDLEVKANGDTENIFFQSANIFEVPPEEVLPTLSGYGGTQHKFACVLTKAGYVFPDNKQGKVFIYNGQSLEEISSNGMRIFFRDFMRSTTIEDNPFVSSGYVVGYDERLNRIIFTKKDVDSWTITYNPLKKAWVSYHDYVPDCLYTDNSGTLISLKDNGFYLNNESTGIVKGVYYDATVYPSFIDVAYNPDPEQEKLFVGLNWVTESYPIGSTSLDYNNTLTHITVRSPDHCSGRIELSRYTELDGFYASNTRNVTRTWYFDELRDFVIAAAFLGNFYDDYAIDISKLNTNMEWYDQRRFVDKFVICRYEYDNVIDKRLLFINNSITYNYAR